MIDKETAAAILRQILFQDIAAAADVVAHAAPDYFAYRHAALATLANSLRGANGRYTPPQAHGLQIDPELFRPDDWPLIRVPGEGWPLTDRASLIYAAGAILAELERIAAAGGATQTRSIAP